MLRASPPDSASKLRLRERLRLFWNRALGWMHVDGPVRHAPDIGGVVSPVASPIKPPPPAKAEHSLPSTNWRSVDESARKMLAGLAPGSRVAETYDVLRVIAEG